MQFYFQYFHLLLRGPYHRIRMYFTISRDSLSAFLREGEREGIFIRVEDQEMGS